MSLGVRHGSLCSGYDGLSLGLMAVVGGSVAWHSEIDEAPASVLAHHWPSVPNLRDLTAVDWSTVEEVDWLSAGYPCQPFSLAGKRKGADDERHLWPYVAGAIGVLRPRRVFLENVAGHVSMGLGAVLGDLAGLGYDAVWGVVRASEAGAPHARARLFIVAADTRGDGRGGDEKRDVGPEGGISASRGDDVDRRDLAATDADRIGLGGRPEGRDRGPDEWEPRPATPGRGAAVADSEGERRHGGGSARGWGPGSADGGEPSSDADGTGPQGRESAGRLDVPAWGVAPDPGGVGLGPPDGSGWPAAGRCGGAIDWGVYGPAIDRWSRVLGRAAPVPYELGTRGQRRLSPVFVEWMQGLSEGHVTGVSGLSRKGQLKALGNGVVPQQAELALRLLLPRLELALAA